MLQQISPILESHRLNLLGKLKDQQGAPRKFNNEQALGLWLHWMKHYDSEDLLAVRWETDSGTISLYLRAVLYAFLQVFDSPNDNAIITVPDRKTRDANSVPLTLPDGSTIKISEVVDGSEQDFESPGNKFEEQSTYSGKAHAHTRNIQISCSPKQGFIYTCSKSERGAKNDINNYSKPTNRLHEHLDKDEGIAGDQIYAFINSTYGCLVVTPIPDLETARDSAKKKYNQDFKAIRIIIENIFCQIKKWKICSHVFRHSPEIHSAVWKAAAILVQLQLRWKALRNKN